MKKGTMVYVGIFLAVAFGLLASQLLTSAKDDTPAGRSYSVPDSSPLPISLDSLYPPTAKEPVYLIRMFGLNERLAGVLLDLMEEDLTNVEPGFEQFKEDYVEVSRLVPEWEALYPLEPVEELGKALKSGDKGGIMAAFDEVGHTCHVCHIEYMAGIKAKFHWQDFRQIKAKDPIAKAEVDFVQMMRNLNLSFTGVSYDLKQGQMQKAQEHARAFQAIFQAMSETCQECHGTSERRYYVDDGIRQAITGLTEAFSKNPVDQKDINDRVMAIGMESCFKCHLVHIPPAYAKYQWGK